MKTIFKENLPFLIPYILFIVFGGLLIFLNTKAETHLRFNAIHNSTGDVFFYYITFLGDGVTALLVGIMLLAVRFKYAFLIGLSNVISSLVTQLLKRTLFADVVRPKKFFEGMHDLYLVPGVENHILYSFPSGHATCAFSLYFSLALIVGNKMYKMTFFLIALLVAYSRVYLSQHFFEDIYTGSIIGVAVSVIIFYFIKENNKAWLDKSLISVFK